MKMFDFALKIFTRTSRETERELIDECEQSLKHSKCRSDSEASESERHFFYALTKSILSINKSREISFHFAR